MDSAANGTPKPLVLVTGGAGFIASHIVHQLHARGYRVRATVRSKANKERYKHIALPGVEIVEADLLTPGSFDDVVKGCEYVLHTASPYTMSLDDPQKNIVEPAVRGTLNVLNSCLQCSTVRRVVLTSSIAAITDDFYPCKVYSEQDWNTKSSLKRNPYYLSKTLAEKAALQFMREHAHLVKFSLVVLAPALVIGPTLDEHPPLNVSNGIIRKIINGQVPGVLNIGFPVVDVRDCAEAHILLMESPKARGRYILYHTTLWMHEICTLVRRKYPHLPVPHLNMKSWPFSSLIKLMSLVINMDPLLSSARMQEEFDFEYTDIVVSLYDTVDDLIKKGFVTNKRILLIPKF